MRYSSKKMIKRTIAFGLIALMACVNPLQTMSPTNNDHAFLPTVAKAAEADALYVGEVRLAVDDKADVAKKTLVDAGYEVIDQDLNQEAGSWWNDLGDQAVYMGIKRTGDENKAIRDMKTMNMLGKYSYTSLQEWLNSNKKEAKEKVKPVIEALKEYRANVKCKDSLTLQIKNMLDYVKEDDSGKTMGELFLDESCDETVLAKLMLEGNSEVLKTVLYELPLTLEEKKGTWLDRLSGITKKSLTQEYTREMYGVDQVTGTKKAEVEKRLRSEYDRDARKILERWDEINSVIVKPEMAREITKEDIEKMITVGGDQAYEEYMEEATILRDTVLVNSLKEIPYSGKTLVDLFKLRKESFKKDITRLYPIVAALSPGQRAMLDYISLDKLTEYAIMRRNLRNNIAEDLTKSESVKEVMGQMTEISIYEGVDRAMFKDGAAMTSRATEAMKSDGADAGNDLIKTAKNAGVTFLVLGFLTAAAMFVRNITKDQLNTYKFSIANKIKDFLGDENDVRFFSKALKVETVLVGLLIVATVVSLIVSISTYITGQIKMHNRKQLPIPTVIVDKDTQSDITGYMAYSAVLWNRNRQDDTGRDDRGDLNGDAGDQWLALYTSTDKKAGDPILADTIIANTGKNNGKTVPGDGFVPLTMFGNTSIQNLVDGKYSYNDEVDGIWMWYKKGAKEKAVIDDTGDEGSGVKADTTASNISQGSVVLIGTGCAAGGFLLGLLCMFFFRRKKQAVK